MFMRVYKSNLVAGVSIENGGKIDSYNEALVLYVQRY